MSEEKIINGYYQTNIKTSRNEDSVYAMRYANQQMMIDKLQNDKELLEKENTQLKIQLLEKKCSDKDVEYKEKIKLQQKIDKALEDIKEYKEMNYSKYYENEIEIELIDKIIEILKGSDK